MAWRNKPGIIAIGLGAIWLAVQVGLLFFGPHNSLPTPHLIIRHGNDTERYLTAAQSLLMGMPPIGKAKGFLGYDLFVAFFLWSGLGQMGIVLAQALLTSVAAYCLYRLTRRVCDRRTGLLAALFYIVYAELQYWNFYILPESLFVSMTIISLFLVAEWRGWWRMTVTGLIVLFTAIIRPHGIILLLSVGLYAMYSLWRARRYKVLVGVACAFVVASPMAIKLVGGVLADYHPINQLAKGIVVAYYKESRLVMPGVLPAGLEDIKNPLFQISLFIAKKPGYFLQVAGMRLWYLFITVRPFYSDFHNYLLLLTLVPSYVLAVWGVISRSEYPAEKLLLVSLCCFQSLIVALTFVGSNGRYSLVIMPIVFVFAARGALNMLEAGKALVMTGSK